MTYDYCSILKRHESQVKQSGRNSLNEISPRRNSGCRRYAISPSAKPAHRRRYHRSAQNFGWTLWKSSFEKPRRNQSITRRVERP